MENKVNLADKLALLDGPFRPGIVGHLNDYKLAVVKALGEKGVRRVERTFTPRGNATESDAQHDGWMRAIARVRS